MSLRERLRAETRQGHDRVDARFSDYDIRARTGYAGFLSAHAAALADLRPHIDGADGRDLMGETHGMLCALGQDLDRLGWPGPAMHTFYRRMPYHSDAVRYVLFGSQIGLAQLRRRWAAEPLVRGACAFLTLKVDGRRWNDLCARLAACPGQGVWADGVTADARALFDLYARHADAFPHGALERSA